ncbi:chemotaxis protein [Roseibium aestuarii]|uniref:Chemotaxis protein n=1 Tax=Roseibium aestuarii TaxID=2600299 RepID=A0ABW4JX14_9HYPH|nr:chemotaxis protein [Roseibium aestuarii]
MTRSVLGGLMLLAMLVCGGASAQSFETQPYEMVRTLQELQGQVAEGNSQAVAAQRVLLLDMDARFTRLPAEAWQDPRNARAAIIHVLSGGHPAVLRRLTSLSPAPAVEPALLQAALAYVEGRESDVVVALEGVDIAALPPALGGHVALIKAAAILREDPQAALEALTLARLLMPGSLVEEAALRREIFVSGKVGDIERFQSLAIRYLRRYRDSIYAGDFRRRFALSLDALGFGRNAEKFALIEGLLMEFDADTRRELYLRLARTGLLNGERLVVDKASAEGLKLAIDGSHEEMLFKLYRAGSLLEIENIKVTRDMLWSIDKDLLTAEERELMRAIFAVVNSVRHFPTPPGHVIGEMDVYETLLAPKSADWVRPGMTEVEDLIEKTNAQIQKVGG